MKIKFFSMAIVGLLFAACSNSDVVEPTDPNNGNKPVVSFSLANASTRADAPDEPGTTEESAISRLVFYVFTKDGELLQTNPFSSKQSQYKFAIDATGSQLTDMNFLVGVNQDEITGIPAGNTALTFVKGALLNSLELGPDNSTVAPEYFPMSGELLGQSVTVSTGEDNPVTPLTIKVSRLVSKVEVPKTNAVGVALGSSVIKEVLGEEFSTGKFTLEGYVLINGLNKSDAFYTWTNEKNDWTTWKRDGKSYFSSEFDETGTYTNVYAGNATVTDHFIKPADKKTVYVFENQPKDDASQPTLYFDKSTVYSLIIKGKITSGDDSKEVTRYWRANLIPDDNHTVIRNAIYRLTIDAVSTAGYETPEEAEKEEVVPKKGIASVLMTIEVLNWRVKTTSTNL